MNISFNEFYDGCDVFNIHFPSCFIRLDDQSSEGKELGHSHSTNAGWVSGWMDGWMDG
jgi:hypothetical protein